MCMGCVSTYLDGEVVYVTEEVRTVAALVNNLYLLDGSCCVGSPMHNVLDDYNLEDDQIRWYAHGDQCISDNTHVPEIAKDLGWQISWRLLRLTVPERAVAVAMAHGHLHYSLDVVIGRME